MRRTSITVLAATDPAQPYGAQLAWPRPPAREGAEDPEGRGGRRPSRVAGAYVLLCDGDPVVYVERGGKGILLLARIDDDELAARSRALNDAAEAGIIPRLASRR